MSLLFQEYRKATSKSGRDSLLPTNPNTSSFTSVMLNNFKLMYSLQKQQNKNDIQLGALFLISIFKMFLIFTISHSLNPLTFCYQEIHQLQTKENL